MGKLREIQSRILVYTMIIDMDDDNLGYEMDAFFVSAEVNSNTCNHFKEKIDYAR